MFVTFQFKREKKIACPCEQFTIFYAQKTLNKNMFDFVYQRNEATAPFNKFLFNLLFFPNSNLF